MPLPILDLIVISELFGVVIASLSVFWGINKAIIISKSH